MRKIIIAFPFLSILMFVFFAACSDGATPEISQTETSAADDFDYIQRGDYITSISGCNDCHTPKIFGPTGPMFDSTRLLSGHPEGSKMPPINKESLQPGNWISFSPDLTMTVGPWGITYSANLTPDTATGIGLWSEATFIKALRSGKHAGMDNGRPILPPMPWQEVAKMTDQDLKSVYAYLRSLPPINNRVPGPMAPADVEKIAK